MKIKWRSAGESEPAPSLAPGRLRNGTKNATALTMNLKGNRFIRPL